MNSFDPQLFLSQNKKIYLSKYPNVIGLGIFDISSRDILK